ncbi:MAG: gliding motility lipoprotein GldH [Prevotellaceae bacterium]|jgi:gliding motility-associated lipoprotein GldH|nr:gliding motility lipoprotein GldH [Prevotellaceae bacterium]
MTTGTGHGYFFVLLFTIVIAWSCADRNGVWRQNGIITDCRWNKDSTLRFDIPVDDTVSLYSISVNLRNRTDYGFQNLYLFLNITAPGGAATTDTLNFILAYDDGRWTGSGGLFSKYRENMFLYRKYVRFPYRGNYTASIRHGMRKDELEGISSVGLSLSFSED